MTLFLHLIHLLSLQYLPTSRLSTHPVLPIAILTRILPHDFHVAIQWKLTFPQRWHHGGHMKPTLHRCSNLANSWSVSANTVPQLWTQSVPVNPSDPIIHQLLWIYISREDTVHSSCTVCYWRTRSTINTLYKHNQIYTEICFPAVQQQLHWRLL